MTDRESALEEARKIVIALDTNVIGIDENGNVTNPAAEILADALLRWKAEGYKEGFHAGRVATSKGLADPVSEAQIGGKK